MRKQVRFCVVASPRSGSTWLMDMLNNQPGIRAYGEVFLGGTAKVTGVNAGIQPPMRYGEFCDNGGHSAARGIMPYLRLLEADAKGYEAVGFKAMYEQLRWFRLLGPALLMRGYRMVHLRRENLVDAYLSWLLSTDRGVWHTSSTQKLRSVDVDVSVLITELEKRRNSARLVTGILAALPCRVCSVAYETLCVAPKSTVGRITTFLGIRPSVDAVTSEFRRVNPGALADKIRNYDEVADALKDSPFERWLIS
jgi:hypothetical protein